MLQTNLIVENGLLYIFEKPEHFFIILGVVGRLLPLRPIRRQAQLLLNNLELAERVSALNVND